MAIDPMLEPNRFIADLARRRREEQAAIARSMGPSSSLYAQAMGAGTQTDPRRPSPVRAATDAAIAPDARVRSAMAQRAAQPQARDTELPAVRQPPQYQQPDQRGFFKKLFDSIGGKDPNAQADARYKREMEAQEFLRDQDEQNYQLETQRMNADEQSAALEQYRTVRAQQIAAQMAAAEEARNPSSIRSQLARKLAAPYADPELIAQASEDQILKLMPFLKAEIDKEEAALKHSQRLQQIAEGQAGDEELEAQRQEGRLELQGLRGAQNIEAAGRLAKERIAAREMDFKKSYQQNLETDLDVAALIQDVQNTPGGAAPEGFAERFRNSITARGIDPARLESWQSKHMILELWSRKQSGAAISGTEDGKFITQTGMNPYATPEQVEAAFSVLRRITARRLRGAAAANKSAARAVASEYGLDTDAWLGKEEAAPAQRSRPARQAAPTKRKPAAAPARSSGDGEWEDVGGSSSEDDEWEDL